jgi:cell division protein ZapA
MANVIVTVADRPYTMQCPDGEEEHLRELARLLDTEVQRIRRSVGQVGDIRMLVMAGLMVADRLSESVRRIETVEAEVKMLRDGRAVAQQQTRDLEVMMTERLDSAAKRLEALARSMA